MKEVPQQRQRRVDISEKIKAYEWEKLPWRWIVERTFGWLNAASSLIKVLYIANLQYFLTTKEIP